MRASREIVFILTKERMKIICQTCDENGLNEKHSFTDISDDKGIAIYCLDYHTGQPCVFKEGDEIHSIDGEYFGVKNTIY